MNVTQIQVNKSFTYSNAKAIRRGIDILTGKLLANVEALGMISEDESINLFLLSEFKNDLSSLIEQLETRPDDEAPIIFLGGKL